MGRADLGLGALPGALARSLCLTSLPPSCVLLSEGCHLLSVGLGGITEVFLAPKLCPQGQGHFE